MGSLADIIGWVLENFDLLEVLDSLSADD
ncbi:hypothetical protein RHRU231_330197 [Rhodococcus ruber]|uniref:Uncharacterized protein n=1 Tax=Rhodococcus ruber TaxID=1830 RepID=A0A098BHP2_9NOCA|nr:hypothetical protein RHRU231_330197 [Rhodococcus ruber]